MPTYTVFAPAGRLSGAQKQSVAREVTRVHNEVTGAQTFFAQVIFVDVPAGNWFVGGSPLQGDQVFVHGQVRGERPKAMKAALLAELLKAVGEAGAFASNRVWGYIVDLPPADMAEYGHVLPMPGREAEWLAGLPADDRALMQRLGRIDAG